MERTIRQLFRLPHRTLDIDPSVLSFELFVPLVYTHGTALQEDSASCVSLGSRSLLASISRLLSVVCLLGLKISRQWSAAEGQGIFDIGFPWLRVSGHMYHKQEETFGRMGFCRFIWR